MKGNHDKGMHPLSVFLLSILHHHHLPGKKVKVGCLVEKPCAFILFCCVQFTLIQMVDQKTGMNSVLIKRCFVCLSLHLPCCSDLLDDEDEIDEHQPFPSLSQVNDLMMIITKKLHI